jgi:hypothetical protein
VENQNKVDISDIKDIDFDGKIIMSKKTIAGVLLRLEKGTLEKIDDFRFAHRFQSRTKTIRWLLKYALKQNPRPKK